MRRALAAHALLLLLAAAASWLSWQHVSGQDRRAGRLVLNLDPASLQAVTHDWPGGVTEVHVEGRGQAREAAVRLTDKPQPAPGETPGAAEVHVGPPSAVVERGLAALTPLRARRSWAEPDAALERRLGFAEQDRWMSLSTDAGPIRIEFGVETYGGEGRYIRLQGDPAIHLVDAQLARAFEGPASRLIDARLVRIEREQVLNLTLRLDGREARFRQLDREQPRLHRFVLASTPDKPAPAIESALKSLRGTFSRNYVDAAEVRGETLFTLHIERDRHAPLAVELIRGGDGQTFWLRSGRWQARLNPVAARKLIEEMRAAMPTMV